MGTEHLQPTSPAKVAQTPALGPKPRQVSPGSRRSSHSPRPKAHRKHLRARADAHPGAKHVQGGREGTHAVAMAAEASHTDLETPVVWLLMEIREEMVMRDLGCGAETLGAHWHSALAPGPTSLWGAGRKWSLGLLQFSSNTWPRRCPQNGQVVREFPDANSHVLANRYCPQRAIGRKGHRTTR